MKQANIQRQDENQYQRQNIKLKIQIGMKNTTQLDLVQRQLSMIDSLGNATKFNSLDEIPVRKSFVSTPHAIHSQPDSEDCQNQSKTCRVHSLEKAIYFVAEQPWNRFCKQCALNKALCGHKIQKQLKQEQFQKKTTLTSLIHEMKRLINLTQEQSKYLGETAQKISNHYEEMILPSVKVVDKLLEELNKAKQNIYKIYEQKISQKVNQLYEKQKYIRKSQQSLKDQLENIEKNYCDLISNDDDDGAQFNRHIDLIKCELQKLQGVLETKDEKECWNRNIEASVNEFVPILLKVKEKKTIFDNILQEFKRDNRERKRKQTKQNQEPDWNVKDKRQQKALTSRRYSKSALSDFGNMHNQKNNKLTLRHNSKQQSLSSSAIKYGIGSCTNRESGLRNITSLISNTPASKKIKNFCF